MQAMTIIIYYETSNCDQTVFKLYLHHFIVNAFDQVLVIHHGL